MAPGEKFQKGPAAQSPARKKQKITGATASTTTKETRFRDTVCDFDDDVMKEVEKQDGKRLGPKDILEMSLLGGPSSSDNRALVRKDGTTRIQGNGGRHKDNGSGMEREDIRIFFEEGQESGDEHCGFEISHTIHWVTFFDEKVVDENSRLYRSTDEFDWGKWHREQGMLVISLAKKKGNTSFSRSIMATLRCTNKGAKPQSKLDSPEDWEGLMESLEH